jgi:hypothetical protein
MLKNRGRGIIVKNRYFDFLCNIVDEDGSCGYDKLLGELHGIEFYSLIPNDDNRGEDGKQLRQRFIDEEGQHALSQSHLDECTVLEMLIGLSYRLEFETMSSRWEKTPKEWFWILIDNLGLNTYVDGSFIPNEVLSILKTFLDRGYKNSGDGGLFPLHKPKKDQRRVEIWYQMSAYVLENYPI